MKNEKLWHINTDKNQIPGKINVNSTRNVTKELRSGKYLKVKLVGK